MIENLDEQKAEVTEPEPKTPEEVGAEIILAQSDKIKKMMCERDALRTQLDIQHDLVTHKRKIIDSMTPILERCYNYISWESEPRNGNKFGQTERTTEIMTMLGYLQDNGYTVDMPKAIRRATKEPEIFIPPICPIRNIECMVGRCEWYDKEESSCVIYEINRNMAHIGDNIEALDGTMKARS